MEWKKRIYDVAKFSSPEEKLKHVPTSVSAESKATAPTPASSAEAKPVRVNPRAEEMKEKESDESNPDFRRLVSAFKLKEGSDKYYRVRDLFYSARRKDVKYEVERYLWSTLKHEDVSDVIDRLLKQGYQSGAYSWWVSAQPEGMQYGTATREKRLAIAEEFAQKAGVSLEEILRSRRST